MQTPAPVEAMPGDTVPCNLDRGKYSGSSRARKLIVIISGCFRTFPELPEAQYRAPEKTPDGPGSGQWSFNT